MSSEDIVVGRGLSALSCAALLARQGRRLVVIGAEPGGARPLVLPAATVELLRELHEGDPDLTGWRLDRREVRWGPGARPATVDAPALVVDGAELNARLEAALVRRHGGAVRFLDAPADDTEPSGWSVVSVSPPDDDLPPIGRRQMITAAAALTDRADARTALVRSSSNGWVHIAPLGPRTALVQAMVPGPAADPAGVLARQLDETGLAEVVEQAPAAAVTVPAAPRLRSPLCAGRSLTVGSAAARLDPLCGSGVLHALRTAVLGAAVVDAVGRGTPEPAAATHFTGRVHRSFRDHLRHILAWYRSAVFAPQWQDEVDATVLALRRLGAQDPDPQPRFRLDGFRLAPGTGPPAEQHVLQPGPI